MNVKLIEHSKLSTVVNALNMSHDSHDKMDKYLEPTDNITDKDRMRIERVINKLKHKSVAEMAVYWFDIDGISRGCLQELARHRTARLTVKSSRYTLKELKYNCSFYNTSPTGIEWRWDEVEKFCVLTGRIAVDESIARALSALQYALEDGISNDIAKYCLPEAFKTRLQFQCDGRNLQNFLELRTSKDALWEIQNLARAIYDALPSEHRYLYEECVKGNTNDKSN